MNYVMIGYGGRGTLYSELLSKEKDAHLIAVCDTDEGKLRAAQSKYGLSQDRLFLSEDEFFAKGKLADICFVCTQDRLHCRHALKALDAGYDLVLEKPIATTLEDCMAILNKSKRLKRKVFVCHVLRYAPFFARAKEELDDGRYGKISTILIEENVSYWHYAHSYVRGNWRNSDTSSPMIIAKCCHDLDLFQYFIGEKCTAVSSMGGLSYFTRKNAPENSADRCCVCPCKNDCAYNAERFYIEERAAKGNFKWPVDIVAFDKKIDTLVAALQNGPYGRCVYKCDNNVVDHQVVDLLYEGGATAHLTMTAFSKDCFRRMHIHGEKGEIFGDMLENKLYCNIYGKESKVIDLNGAVDTSYGHGGGDILLMQNILEHYRSGKAMDVSTIEDSFASHVIGFAAERSRLHGGEKTDLV